MAKKESENVLYRKYRPERFKEVLEQEHIVSALEGALKQGNVAHAYLFTGSRGTGKTSVARILASAVNVSSKDLYEIDAASNRGIDDIRELRDAVHTLPFESPYKLYIIDEVHMLTKEAFNALLKTLEEPPPHVLFVLATTELEKLPETIVSRCQTFTFHKPSQKALREMVTKTAKNEGFSLEESAGDLIALLADGSFRDALGVLQKVIFASADKEVSVAEVERITGSPKGELINDCILAIEAGDVEKALVAMKNATEVGTDPRLFTTLLLHKVRSALLLRFAPALSKQISEQFSESDRKVLEKVADSKDSRITPALLLKLLDAQVFSSRASVPILPLEMALMEYLDR